MVAFPAIMLGWLQVLIHTFHPQLAPHLQPLSTALWDYLLPDPTEALPNFIWLDMRARRHMLDVKHALSTVQHLTYWSLGIWLALLGVQYRLRQQWQRALKASVVVGVVILASAAGAALLDFRASFSALHHLFFTNQSWVFPRTNTLIQLYPLTYFQQFFLLWSSLAVATWAGLWWAARTKDS